MPILPKTKQILAYIIHKHPRATVTVLMKLSYLMDLIGIKNLGRQITDFEYIRYYFGPFDNRIYAILSELEQDKLLKPVCDYTFTGDEYMIYSIESGAESNLVFDKIEEAETAIIDKVLTELKGYGPKTLTEIAYKTAPMRKLNATIGGNENLNAKLDLTSD